MQLTVTGMHGILVPYQPFLDISVRLESVNIKCIILDMYQHHHKLAFRYLLLAINVTHEPI